MSDVIPFKPIGSVVVVIPHASAPSETESGIVLADVTYDAETSGTVIAIGSAFCCHACEQARTSEFAIGNRVLFDRGAGLEVDGAPFGLVGEKFLLLQEAEVLAILEGSAVAEVM